jgi:hypothetical protein
MPVKTARPQTAFCAAAKTEIPLYVRLDGDSGRQIEEVSLIPVDGTFENQQASFPF